MKPQATLTESPSVQGWRNSFVVLGRLLQPRSSLSHACRQLDAVKSWLETLPLSTSQYGLACNHLTNMAFYLKANERGAAIFELNMLRGALNHIDDRFPGFASMCAANEKVPCRYHSCGACNHPHNR